MLIRKNIMTLCLCVCERERGFAITVKNCIEYKFVLLLRAQTECEKNHQIVAIVFITVRLVESNFNEKKKRMKPIGHLNLINQCKLKWFFPQFYDSQLVVSVCKKVAAISAINKNAFNAQIYDYQYLTCSTPIKNDY